MNINNLPTVKLTCLKSNASATEIFQAAHNQTAIVWTGDFQNAKQVLAAFKKRVRQPKRPPEKNKSVKQVETAEEIQMLFHCHRMKQAQQSRLINMLMVEIQPGFTLNLPRSPDVRAALADVYSEPNNEPFLIPLNILLGFIGAHEWHKKGVEIASLNAKIHVPYGVFSPLRGEYLDLVMQAPLPDYFQTAFDIGTGSGILAALLAKRGVSHIVATDNNPRAIQCAHENIDRLGFNHQVHIEATDLFPADKADLIVCNPPWLPAKPTSDIETALYDPNHVMLRAFLNQAGDHLNDNGEIWLIISDLAEHLHLRSPEFLRECFAEANLKIVDTLNTKAKHSKATDPNDPLAFARHKEITFLYRLQKIR